MTDISSSQDPLPQKKFHSSPGHPLPLGPTRNGANVNFSLFCRQAIEIDLLLYKPGSKIICQEFSLVIPQHRTGDIWHIKIHNIPGNFEYIYRICTEDKDRCLTKQLALDPYARRITGGERWGQTVAEGWRCGLNEDENFDWAGDLPLRRPPQDAIIYELHVRGFTRHPSAQVRHPGTFLGIIEKIPYLQSLGITAIELLPMTEFDENENKATDPLTGSALKNFWGYSPLAYCAPKASYAARSGQQIRE
ncbi:MAG: alpha-amylase family glycosyl hydrolase, partial [Desulfobulbaceae bacterium]|nr:alpha-amylase family glycosyl hydrolase [Desulfobulbaceae bacterium]